MDINEFYQLVKEVDELTIFRLECGEPDLPGLLLDYENNQGERRQFRVINIKSSPYPGCFEADCYSAYADEYLQKVADFYDQSMAVSTHRTFKIANIISAKKG